MGALQCTLWRRYILKAKFIYGYIYINGLIVGIQIKRRFCTNPTPMGGGNECSGEDKMTKKCKAPDCPGKILFSN